MFKKFNRFLWYLKYFRVFLLLQKKSQELKVYIVVYVIPKLSGVHNQDVTKCFVYTYIHQFALSVKYM